MYKLKIIILIIFFSFQNLLSQNNQIISDTINLKEVTIESINIPLKEKKSLYPISFLKFNAFQQLTPQINISEYLESVPGLFVLNNNNYAQDARISIRGFGSRANFGIRGIKIFVDGIPETSPDGQSQIDNVNLEIIEKIEVYRGNNSSLFGSSSGGAILISTFEDFNEDFIDIGYSSGSFKTTKSQATIGLANDNQKMVFFISNTKSNGFRSHSGFENFNLNFKYLKEINSSNKLQIIANVLNSPDALDPGGLNLEEVTTDRSQARARNIDYDAREEVKQYKLGLNLTSIIKKLKLTNSLYYNQRLFYGKLPFNNGGIVDLNRAFWGYNLNFNINSFLKYDFGFSYNNQNDKRLRFNNNSGEKSNKTMDQDEKYKNLSLYFFGSKSVKKFNFSFGLRFEENLISLENYFQSINEKTKKINSLNPSINLLYELGNLNLFTNFSTGYETPTLNELSANDDQSGFNDNLKTIKSKTFELGISNYNIKNNFNYSVRFFNISTINEITPYESSSGLRLYRNAGKTTKKGVEMEINSKISNNLNLDYSLTIGSYKFDDFKSNDNDYSNNWMPGIPDNNHNLKLKYFNKKGLNVILNLRSVGNMFADNANNTEIDGYNTIGFKISKKLDLFKINMIPFISIDNLLNQDYYDNIRINAFGSRFYEPAAGINLIGGVKINL